MYTVYNKILPAKILTQNVLKRVQIWITHYHIYNYRIWGILQSDWLPATRLLGHGLQVISVL